jgi:hypothetical protein
MIYLTWLYIFCINILLCKVVYTKPSILYFMENLRAFQR